MITVSETPTSIEQWFDEIVASIRRDQLAIETGTAPQNTQILHRNLMDGNLKEHFRELVKGYNLEILHRMITDYMREIKDYKPRKLAFELNGSEVLVWAEIADDDDTHEAKLIMAEARINAEYRHQGFDLTTTFVEQSGIPNHYSPVIQ
jgi:hypothetical protein